MINKKNDGTVKMTRQRATNNTYGLGMTVHNRTLEGYTRDPTSNPRVVIREREAVLRRKREIELSPAPEISTAMSPGFCLVHNLESHLYYLIQERPGGRLKSVAYRNKQRAMIAYGLGRITWIEFQPTING